MSCDVFEVSGATDTSFNGEYEVSPVTVPWAQDKDVYEKKITGGKFMFWKDGEWALGTNLNTGAVNYAGTCFTKCQQLTVNK